MERWAGGHYRKRPIMKLLILFTCCMVMVVLLFSYFIDFTCDEPTYQKIIQNYPRSTASKTELNGAGCSKWGVVTISSCSLPIPNLSSLLDIASLPDWCVVLVTPKDCKSHLHINQKQHIAIIDQGSDDAVAKHSGYIFAIEHGAEEIFDFDATQDLILESFLDAGNKDFIEITYPTGSVWNPYTDFLNKSDIWPRGFPQGYKDNVQEELSKYREMIPFNNVGVIQSLARNYPDLDASHKNYPISGDGQENKMIALGLKTFVPFNGLSTRFYKSVFWGLFLPKTVGGEVSDIVRSFIIQKLMWKLGKNVAYSSPWVVNHRPYQHATDESLYEETVKKLDELDLDCNSIPICLKEIYKNLVEWNIVHEEEMTSHTKWIESLMYANYTFPELLKPKPFVYLIMGQSKTSTPSKSSPSPGSVPVMSLKPNNVSDVFFVFWGDKTGDIFYPKSTYPQGRNSLLRHALAMEQSPGYEYFVFFDDDMVLSNKDDELFYWKKEMKASPIKRFQEFLIKFKPNFAAPQYPRTALVPSKGPFTLSIVADSSMNAYSRDTIKFLNPIVESFLDDLSFYNHNLIKDFLLKVFYWRSSMHCNSVQGKNSRSGNHFDTKKRDPGSIYVVDKDASSGTSPKETFEFLINNLEPGDNNPLKKVVLRLRDITGFKTNWFKFSQDNVSMEIISSISQQNVDSYGLKFVPDLLKYFNKCQSIYKSRYIWQSSKIISNDLRVTHENVPNC